MAFWRSVGRSAKERASGAAGGELKWEEASDGERHRPTAFSKKTTAARSAAGAMGNEQTTGWADEEN